MPIALIDLRLGLIGLAVLLAAASGAQAQSRPPAGGPAKPGETAPARPAAAGRSSALGGLGSNKDPIKIDSDRLDVFDKEGRAVFAGNVVAVQGDSTMRCASLTVHYESGRGAAVAGQSPGGDSSNPLARGDSAIKKLDCKGPVTIATKTQVATGDNAEFDRTKNKVFLIGNAALTDGPNVTRGERVAYDLNTGVANVEGGRVRALIVPGSQKPAAAGAAPKPR